MTSSKIDNEIKLKQIVAPSLNSIEYATSINNAFNNIKSNFITLSNRDFVKGETGDSLNLHEVDFFDADGNLTFYGNKLVECIETTYPENIRKSIYDKNDNEISLWDNFRSNPGKLYVLFGINSDILNDIEEPLTSLNYIFLDGRFINNKIQQIESSQYLDIKDLSSILVYDKSVSGFKILQNAFPTLYLNSELGWCWKFNGIETEISAQGPQGLQGLNSPLYTVYTNELEQVDTILQGDIKAIFDPVQGYIDITENNITAYKDFVGCSCLIITDNSRIYFGNIVTNNNELQCVCNSRASINNVFEANQLKDIMSNIDINNIAPESIKGLFVPISNTNSSAHLLSSNYTINNLVDKNDVLLTPTSDVNSVDPICVDKYLYVRINTNSNFFTNSSLNDDIAEKVISENGFGKYDYVLKYKLTDKVADIEEFNSINRYFTREGIKMEVESPDGTYTESIKIDSTNVEYYDLYSTNVVSDDNVTIPDEFKDRLNNSIGIYCWELCNTKNNWDVIELFSKENGDKYAYMYLDANDTDKNEAVNLFKKIYTTTLIPNSNTDFMWFNSACLDYRYEDTTGEKLVIPGWDCKLYSDLIQFIKYIPVYTTKYESDNLLNINYSVNISGDSINTKRDLFVNGTVSCDSIDCKDLMNIINELKQQINNLQSQIDDLKNSNNPEPENPETV